MNVNEPSRSFLSSSAATSQARQTILTQPEHSSIAQPFSAEDSHLSELLRCLRSLSADSPERQAKIEALMRAYATGNLQVDAEDTASAIIEEAVTAGSSFR